MQDAVAEPVDDVAREFDGVGHVLRLRWPCVLRSTVRGVRDGITNLLYLCLVDIDLLGSDRLKDRLARAVKRRCGCDQVGVRGCCTVTSILY